MTRTQVNQAWRNRNPWFVSLRMAKERCNRPKNNRYPWYGARGIKCLITLPEVKRLWLRDGADKMKKPSLDREDRDGHYQFSNCKFMELVKNVEKQNRQMAERNPMTHTEEEKNDASFV